ncbi:ABC transporter ATP-binding protein [Proteiniclasticum sp. SCR006]|uniref:ABC transporter ATP-binding protein n=1 Tax=Proteiniclasticum aestuarii TaxID=2817862 RepID=A0A939KG03_9CLOT|nr:ABC transporter ATP-binding protein [Proteiniclasticum aestuarii]MBO1265002.1 ABC transporter ATP-binding protein [Proteiniclasticum aestuarii]
MIIEVENLKKSYGKLLALDNLNLAIEEGEVFGLLGPNGSGKTTAINCMLSLLHYDAGSIRIFGQEMTPESYDLKKDIGVVMQNVAVFPELTVEENVDYFCGLYVPDRKERKDLVNEAITFTGLDEFRKFIPKKLSGGLLRRLNIACGIAHKPKLIFLDEPTVAVDPQSRNRILEGILELNRKGSTIVYTSHYMEEVETLCSRIMIIDKGKAIATGTREELKSMIHLGKKVSFEAEEITAVQIELLKNLPGVHSVEQSGHTVHLKSDEENGILEKTLAFLKDQDIRYTNIYSEMPTLNDVFLEITGKELRD